MASAPISEPSNTSCDAAILSCGKTGIATLDHAQNLYEIIQQVKNGDVRATTKLYTPATSKDNSRASSHCGLTQRDKLREKEEDGGICQFILTIDITTVKWES